MFSRDDISGHFTDYSTVLSKFYPGCNWPFCAENTWTGGIFRTKRQYWGKYVRVIKSSYGMASILQTVFHAVVTSLINFASSHVQAMMGWLLTVTISLTLNVRWPSYLRLTSSLRRQDISSHVMTLTWGRILSTCVISVWSNDIKCKYMFMFPR